MTVSEFRSRFGDEVLCAEHLTAQRWPNGFVCRRCGGRSRGYMARRRVHECTGCGYQSSVTAGTIFHKTRTPLSSWFWAIYRMSQDKKGISALQLSKEIGVSYPTAWLMQHKIRQAMADRDQGYRLQGPDRSRRRLRGRSGTVRPRRDEEPKPSRWWRSRWNVAPPARKARNRFLGLPLWRSSPTRRPAAGRDFSKPKSSPAVR